MRITCVGGGPAGLYFSLLAKLREPRHDITVFERNAAGATHGWGVTLGRDVVGKLRGNDVTSARAVEEAGRWWTQQTVHVKGERITRGGADVSNIARKALVGILAERASEAGVHLRYEHAVADQGELPPSDLIVIADGARSRLRSAVGKFGTSVRSGDNSYIWLGSSAPFTTFNYIFTPTDCGWIWAYAYQFDAQASTVIVECSARTWEALGFTAMPATESAAKLTDLFAEQLSGHPLIARLPDGTTATWQKFPTVTNQRWHSGNVVLAGDSAHTAHYSLGQGTKMALEDAIALAEALERNADLETALSAYEERRKAELVRPLAEARCSAEWFENLPRYIERSPHQFARLLDSRRSPLVQVLPPWLSYQLRHASDRLPVVNGVRNRIGPAIKARYGRRKPAQRDDTPVRQSA